MCDDVKDWKLGKAVCCVRKRQTARQCISEIQSLISGCCSCHFETWTSAPLCLAVCRTKPLAIDLGNFCICSLFAPNFLHSPTMRGKVWPVASSQLLPTCHDILLGLEVQSPHLAPVPTPVVGPQNLVESLVGFMAGIPATTSPNPFYLVRSAGRVDLVPP